MLAFINDHLDVIFAACSVVSVMLAVTRDTSGGDEIYDGDDQGQL